MAAATPKHPLGELSHAEFSRADGTIIELDFTDPTRPVRLEADKWYSPTTLTQVGLELAAAHELYVQLGGRPPEVDD